MKKNQQLNSMIDSMMTPWKPIGLVLSGKARRQVRRIPGTSPATDYSMMAFPYRGMESESWSQLPAVREPL